MALEVVKPSAVTQTPAPSLADILIDWPAFWGREPIDEEWLVWPLVPISRGVALYAPAKAGKSLVALALVTAAATGRRGLDGAVKPPVEVLYLDYEMSLDDIRERLEDFGYGPDDDLSHLHYASLPSLPALNEPEGAKALMALVAHTGAQLVVIDTLGRAVDGDENEPRTVQEFYKWTGLALKAARVAFLRVDHAGKDLARGQRGHSSKNDDVDVVWQLTRMEGGVLLKCTHRRIGWVPEKVTIKVDDGEGWRFELAPEEQWPEGTKELVDLLDKLDVPIDASRRVANQAIKTAEGQGRRPEKVTAALRFRRSEEARSGSRNHLLAPLRDQKPEPNGQKPSDLVGNQRGTTGNQSSSAEGCGVPSIGRNHPPAPPPEPDLECPF
jgi:hypothetical protein